MLPYLPWFQCCICVLLHLWLVFGNGKPLLVTLMLHFVSMGYFVPVLNPCCLFSHNYLSFKLPHLQIMTTSYPYTMYYHQGTLQPYRNLRRGVNMALILLTLVCASVLAKSGHCGPGPTGKLQTEPHAHPLWSVGSCFRLPHPRHLAVALQSGGALFSVQPQQHRVCLHMHFNAPSPILMHIQTSQKTHTFSLMCIKAG